jgi:Family of unknown function (DUF5947)
MSARQLSEARGPFAALGRFVNRPAQATPRDEVCEMCASEIPSGHSHIVNLESRSLMCACRACYLLFTQQGAAQGKYRAVPERYLMLGSFELTAEAWEEFQIPVGMAFFFFNSELKRVTGFYPSPAGATESMLTLETWQNLVAGNQTLATLEHDVEALLINRPRGGDFECFVVPIDACYELTGIVRRRWKGFDGGEDARRDIDAFFDSLRAKCGLAQRGEPA